MKCMADRYFRINEQIIAVPGHVFGSNRLNPLERRKRGGEKGSKRENLAATYWGLERRRSWAENIFSTLTDEKEREHLTATYWG